MLRVKFKCNYDDPRPVKWPIKHPFWVTGYGASGDYATVVAYVTDDDELMELWPDAYDIYREIVDKYVFTDRFEQPGWFIYE